MKEITLFIDPLGMNIPKYLGKFSDLGFIAKMLELTESFQDLGLTIEKAGKDGFNYWVNSSCGDSEFYIKGS